jgi:hypothetical protein
VFAKDFLDIRRVQPLQNITDRRGRVAILGDGVGLVEPQDIVSEAA